jgi:glutamate-1-semialdehyde 2,1-aminomutase
MTQDRRAMDVDSPHHNYPDESSRSAALYQRARRSIPDGISRSMALIRPHPIYVASGKGAWVTDVDGHQYLDANNNFTSIILGHADPIVNAAVTQRLAHGTAFAMGTEAEIELAELLVERVPSIERIRFCNSGTEAVMGAIKAARGFTGRPMIAKVEGAYHGTYDHAETSLGSGPEGWGDADAPVAVTYAAGTPRSVAEEVAILPFNNTAASCSILERCGDQLAAILIDTLPSRVGLPEVDIEYLETVFAAARAQGALVIMDEVISLRLGFGGNQGRLGLQPDLTSLGKIIGGGFPVGATGGRADIMDVFASIDGQRAAVPTAGTFSANPVTMVAGFACMNQLTEASFTRLEEVGDAIRGGCRDVFADQDLEWQVTGKGSLFRLHPHGRPIRSYREARLSENESNVMTMLQQRLLERGVYFSSYGLGCMNLATSDSDITHFVEAVRDSLTTLTRSER